MIPVILNFVFFQLVWGISLAGVVYGYAWWGPAALCGFMVWHGATAPTARADFVLAGTAVVIGLVLDSVYARADLISYGGSMFWSGVAPLWILGLWANFALTMNGCMRWLQSRKALAAVLAFVFGPLSYYAGIALGAATIIGEQWLLFTAIGVAWAVVLPLLLGLAERFAERFATADGVAITYSS